MSQDHICYIIAFILANANAFMSYQIKQTQSTFFPYSQCSMYVNKVIGYR